MGSQVPPNLLRGKAFQDYWDRIPTPVQSETMVGIEIECENVMDRIGIDTTQPYHELFHNLWVQKEDGSLRNRGREFVTRYGLTATQASKSLYILGRIFGEWWPGIQANARTRTVTATSTSRSCA